MHMLRKFINIGYHFAKTDKQQVVRTFINYRSRVYDYFYYLEVNRKRINFSWKQNYFPGKNSFAIMNQNNGHKDGKQEWSVANFCMLAAGIIAYLLINNQASADEEDENELESKRLQSQEHTNIVSQKLTESLPTAIEAYVDLQGKKEFLHQKLKEKEIVVISGAGGMGKSTLAIQYGNDCQQRGDTQVIWIKGTQIEEEFFRLAGILRITTDHLDTVIIRNLIYGELQTLFHKKKILFIFDNVETKEKVEKYLINLSSNSKVVITARNGELLEGIKPIDIKGFNKKEACLYLRKTLHKNNREIEKIINAVSESPFRLSIIVAYFKKHFPTNVDEFIKKYGEIQEGHKQSAEIYPEVEMLFKDLKTTSPKAWELLKHLAYLDAEGVEVPFIKEILKQSTNELEESVNKLKELSLIEVVEGNKMTLKVTHRIVQDETRKALVEEDTTQAVNIITKLVHKLNEIFPEADGNPENWEKAKKVIHHGEVIVAEAKKLNLSFLEQEELVSKVGSYNYYVKNNYQEAINYWQQLLDYQKNIDQGNNANVASLLNKIGWAYRRLEGEENIKQALNFLEKALEMNKALFSGNHAEIASALSHIGSIYVVLGGEEHLKKGLSYKKEALKMRQTIFHGNHVVIANALNSVGHIYQVLGGEKNLYKGLEYEKEALKMRRALFSENHPHIAISLNRIGSTYLNLGGTENIQKGLTYSEEALRIRKKIFTDNHLDLAVSLDQVGWAYIQLQGKENMQKGLNLLEEALEMRKIIFVRAHSDVATSLNHVGNAYINLGGKDNILKGMKYQEKALEMRRILFFSNHIDVAHSLQEIGQIYQILGDESKNLEYMKQAYSIFSDSFDENHEETRKTKAKIESLQPNFFINQEYDLTLKYQDCLGGNKVGSECRWIITSRGEIKEDLITLKQKLQKRVLNDLVQVVHDKGWSSLNWRWLDEGVKGYLEKSYLCKALGISNNNEIEMAQMLCFESMNLGIMKSKRKPYDVVQSFTRKNPELVKKIAVEHPEYFIDGTIVEACVRAMPENAAFEEHIFKHVKYMGMEERKKRGL